MAKSKKIMNVKLDKVNEELVDQYIDEYEIESDESIEAKVQALAEYFRDGGTKKEFQIAQCDTCGGYSDAGLPECPFCGDDEPIEDDDDESEEEEVEEDIDDIDEEEEEEVEEDTEDIEEEDEVEEDTEDIEDEEPVVDQGPPKKGRPKKSGSKKGKGKGKRSTAKPKKDKLAKKIEPMEIEIVEEDGSTVVWKEKDLDKAVTRIKKQARLTAEQLYSMGGDFKLIHENELWKLRQDKKSGKSTYKNFRKFCADELSMSHNQAYKLIAIFDQFSEDDIKKFGVTKLKLALSVPAEHREEFLDGADKEAASGLSDKAKALKDLGGKTKDVKPADKAVTVALMMGTTELPMWKRPTKSMKVGEETTPAKTLKHEPWAVMDLTNNVQLYIRLDKNDDDELVAIIEARRGKSEI